MRTTTTSVCGKGVATPGRARQGRTPAYRSRSRRSAMLIDRKPEPDGVEVGPFRATPRSRTEAITRSSSAGPSRTVGLGAELLHVPLDRDPGGLDRPAGGVADLRPDAVSRYEGHAVRHRGILIGMESQAVAARFGTERGKLYAHVDRLGASLSSVRPRMAIEGRIGALSNGGF